MHPKTKPKPTVHLETWCRVRCSVSHTTSWTGLSTSLATTPTPARLWQFKHLQGMHEHHIFNSPNAHKQKTYIMHIFPNMSFFHSYLHLQQLQIASVHATLHLWLTTIPSVCLDGIYDFSNTYHTSIYIYIYKGVRGIDHISFLCICILAKLYKSDICITSTASSATSTAHKIHILHVPTANGT